jgi:hypothetical protein
MRGFLKYSPLRIPTVERYEAVIFKSNLEEVRSAFRVHVGLAACVVTWFTCQPQHPKHTSSKTIINTEIRTVVKLEARCMSCVEERNKGKDVRLRYSTLPPAPSPVCGQNCCQPRHPTNTADLPIPETSTSKTLTGISQFLFRPKPSRAMVTLALSS